MLTFHRIESAKDPLLIPWLALYARAFPPEEKVPVSDHLRALEEEPDPEWRAVLLAGVGDDGGLVAMARYELGAAVAYLPYLAVAEAHRSEGYGKRVYEEILARIRREAPRAKALVFEVERPDHSHGEAGAVDAERRIRFYQRLGARLLRGIHYRQEVPGHPPIPMHLMIHPFQPQSPEAALELVRSLFDVERTADPLALE